MRGYGVRGYDSAQSVVEKTPQSRCRDCLDFAVWLCMALLYGFVILLVVWFQCVSFHSGMQQTVPHARI